MRTVAKTERCQFYPCSVVDEAIFPFLSILDYLCSLQLNNLQAKFYLLYCVSIDCIIG